MKRSAPIDIPLQTPATWTSDERVTACFECRTEFSFLNRKHHCRVCGRIFCHDCSKFRTNIPSFIRHFIANSVGSSGEFKRVCTSCFRTTLVANKSRSEIYVLGSLPLPMNELLNLRKVNKRWNGAIKTVVSIWNSIQYKLPYTKFTKLEKILLDRHKTEIAGHSAWAIQCIKALKTIPGQHKHLECSQLFCKKDCSKRLSVFELLELYTHQRRLPIEKWTKDVWGHIPEEHHVHLMPWWVHIFRTRPNVAMYFLNSIKDSTSVLFAYLFELKLQLYANEYNVVLGKILNQSLKIINPNLREDWQLSEKFLHMLEKIGTTEHKHRREALVHSFFRNNVIVLCPWDPTITIQNVNLDMKRLKSASKPLKISLYTEDGTIDILFKSEDVRKDRMTMDVAYWIEKTTDLTFVRYNVMPLTPKSGIITMVKNATTLYDIKHRHQTTLQNFILDRNSNLTITELRKRFIKSVAAACVLSYVLGVGDRHLENMLVTDNGELIHVDFFYLMGEDPKHVKTEMRITPDMLDALGGRGSQTFTEFQERCSDIYTIIRTKSSFWFSLFMYLADASPSIGRFSRFNIREHVLERLCPGELDNEACMQIVEIVKRSSRDSWRNWGVDKAHELAKMSSTLFNMEL